MNKYGKVREGKIMGSMSFKILLAPALLLMCFPSGTGYVLLDRFTGVIEEPAAGPVLGQDFKLKYGQGLTVKGQTLKVKFESLLEDSRCPSDVNCIWEGDAKILISVRQANTKPAEMELHSNAKFAQAGKYQQYFIKLLALHPYPRTSVKTKHSDYVATLVIRKQ